MDIHTCFRKPSSRAPIRLGSSVQNESSSSFDSAPNLNRRIVPVVFISRMCEERSTQLLQRRYTSVGPVRYGVRMKRIVKVGKGHRAWRRCEVDSKLAS